MTLEREKLGKTETREQLIPAAHHKEYHILISLNPFLGTIHPRHIIQATGHSGEASFPSNIAGINDFKGATLCHSSQFQGPKADTKGKKAIIIGSCNSAHDIAQDFHEHGYDVTMVQRSSTLVVSSSNILKALSGFYSEDGVRHISFPSTLLTPPST